MPDRRTLSSSLSARVIEYLRRRGHSQARIARMLSVSEGYISLVKSKERSLTLDHLERISENIAIPLGALMVAVTPAPKTRDKRLKAFFAVSADLLARADRVHDAILRSASSSRR